MKCGELTNNMLYVELKENEKSSKMLKYEVKNIDIRNEIVAKIRYIIVLQFT